MRHVSPSRISDLRLHATQRLPLRVGDTVYLDPTGVEQYCRVAVVPDLLLGPQQIVRRLILRLLPLWMVTSIPGSKIRPVRNG